MGFSITHAVNEMQKAVAARELGPVSFGLTEAQIRRAAKSTRCSVRAKTFVGNRIVSISGRDFEMVVDVGRAHFESTDNLWAHSTRKQGVDISTHLSRTYRLVNTAVPNSKGAKRFVDALMKEVSVLIRRVELPERVFELPCPPWVRAVVGSGGGTSTVEVVLMTEDEAHRAWARYQELVVLPKKRPVAKAEKTPRAKRVSSAAKRQARRSR